MRKGKINKKELKDKMNTGEYITEIANELGVTSGGVSALIKALYQRGDIDKYTLVGWYQKKGERQGLDLVEKYNK